MIFRIVCFACAKNAPRRDQKHHTEGTRVTCATTVECMDMSGIFISSIGLFRALWRESGALLSDKAAEAPLDGEFHHSTRRQAFFALLH